MRVSAPDLGRFLLPLLVFTCPSVAQVEPFGLQGRTVPSLATISQTVSPEMYFLCAGTDSSGVFIYDLASASPFWKPLGLEEREITAVDVFHWGAGPADFNVIFAAVSPEPAAEDSTLLYSFTFLYSSPDTGWVAADSGLAHAPGVHVRSLGSMHFSGHLPPRPAFAGSSAGTIYRSVVYPPWELVWGVGDGGVNVIETLQWQPYWDGVVWAGGETGFFQPYLTKSTDDGTTWETYYPDLGGDNACNSIAIDPDDPDVVYAGMEGMVIKTTNGGDDWLVTGLHGTPYYFYGLVMDPWMNHHLLAGGTSWPNDFALYETFDGGEMWIQIDPGADLPGVSAMVTDTTGGVFTVYLSTWGDGVYRYRTPASALNDEKAVGAFAGQVFCQLRPNPLGAETTLVYRLPHAGSVRFNIYDVSGRRVTSLAFGEREAGLNTQTWHRGGNAPGVYFCELLLQGRLVHSGKMIVGGAP